MRLTAKQSQGIVAAVILWADKHLKANPRGEKLENEIGSSQAAEHRKTTASMAARPGGNKAPLSPGLRCYDNDCRR